MSARMIVILAILSVLAVVPWRANASNPQEIGVSVTAPARDGESVGPQMVVRGVAKLPPSQHIWVLVHRIKGYERVWWPQGEGEVDPVDGSWEVNVCMANC